MRMTLIADSGSTKTDWVLMPAINSHTSQAAHPASERFKTQGINPIHLSDEQIAAILRDELLPHLHHLETISTICFYGSGVRPDQEDRMVRLLHEALLPHLPNSPTPQLPTSPTPQLHIEAHSDLLGAARTLCGDGEGLACILGTGANSCLYDGQRIVANTSPLGYILGDEGSGAVLGIRFLNALYKGHINNETKDAFEAEMQTSLTEVIDRVYRQPLPNRWLASLSPFIHSRLDDPIMEELVIDNFSDFIAHNIEPYHRQDLPIQAVGSIAYYYRDQLYKAAQKAGYAVGKILRSPLEPSGIC